MNTPAVLHHMAELLKLIEANLKNENSHAIVLLNDYMLLKSLYAEYDEVQELLPLVEKRVKESEDWELVKETFIPTLSEENKELVKNLL